MNAKLKKLRDAYYAAYAACNAADRVADDAWNEYQAALKAQGGKP